MSKLRSSVPKPRAHLWNVVPTVVPPPTYSVALIDTSRRLRGLARPEIRRDRLWDVPFVAVTQPAGNLDSGLLGIAAVGGWILGGSETGLPVGVLDSGLLGIAAVGGWILGGSGRLLPIWTPAFVRQPRRTRGLVEPRVRQDRLWEIVAPRVVTLVYPPAVDGQPRRQRGLPPVRRDRLWDTPYLAPSPRWPPTVTAQRPSLRGLRRTNRPAPHAEWQKFTAPPAWPVALIDTSRRLRGLARPEIRRDRLWDFPAETKPAVEFPYAIVRAHRLRGWRRTPRPTPRAEFQTFTLPPSWPTLVVRAARLSGLPRPSVVPRREWETVPPQVVTLTYPPAVTRALRARALPARRGSRPVAPLPLTALAWPPTLLVARRRLGVLPARSHRPEPPLPLTALAWPASALLARRHRIILAPSRRSPHAEFQTFTVPPVWPPLAGQRRAFRGAPVVRGHRPTVTPEQPPIPGLPTVITGRRLRGWRRVPRPLPHAEWFTLIFPPAYPPLAGQRRALRGAPVVRGRRPTVTPEQIPLAGLPAVLTGRRLRGWRIVPRPVPHAGWLSPIFPPAYPPQFVSTARVARGRTVVRSHRPDAPLPLTALAWPPNVVRAYRLRGLLRPPVLARREWEFYPARITPPNPPQILTTARTVRGLRRVPRPAPRAEWQTFTVAPVWPPRVVSTARIVRGLRRVPRPPAHAEWQAFTVPPSWPPDVLSTARTVRGLLRPSVLPRRLWVVPPFQAVAVTTYALSVVSARRPRGIGSVRGRRPDAPLPLTALAWPPPVLARVRPRLGPPARGRVAAAPVLELAAGWTRPPIARRAVAGLAPARSRVLGPVFVELAAGWTPIPPARRLRGWLRVRTARPEALPATVPVPSWPPEARQRALRAPLGARSRPGRLAVPPGPLVGSYAPTALLRPRRAGLLPTRPRRVETVAPPAPPAYPPQFVSTARTLRGLRRERRPWSHAERPPPPPTLAVYPPGIYRSVAPRVLPPRVAGYRTFVVPPGVAFSPAVIWVLGPLAERWALGALVERWETEPGTDRWDLGPLARRWNLDKLRRRWSDGPLGG